MKNYILICVGLLLISSNLIGSEKNGSSFYGKVALSFNQKVDGEIQSSTVASNSSYFGFKGDMEVESRVKALFQVELGLNPDSDSEQITKVRDSYVGLKHKLFGRVRLGNISTPYKKATARIDIYGGLVADYNNVVGRAGKGDSLIFSERGQNAIDYYSPIFKGLQIGVLHAYDDMDSKEHSIDSVALTYKLSGFFLAYGYEVNRDKTLESTKQMMRSHKIGIKFSNKSYSVAALYDLIEDDDFDILKRGSKNSRYSYLVNGELFCGKNSIDFMYFKVNESDDYLLSSNLGSNDGAVGYTVGIDRNSTNLFKMYLHFSLIRNDINGEWGFRSGNSQSLVSSVVGKKESISIISSGLVYKF